MNTFPLSAEEDALFTDLSHLPVCELQVSFAVYCIYTCFTRKELSLPCASYTAVSIIETCFLQAGAAHAALLESPQELQNLLAVIRDQICGLSERYSSEIFKPTYLVRWVSARVETKYQSITLKQMAQQLHISAAYLSSVISDHTGCTFRDMLFCRRLFAFVESVLSQAEESLECTCLKIGYNSIHHFSKIVKKRIGVSPSRLRRNLLLINGAVHSHSS